MTEINHDTHELTIIIANLQGSTHGLRYYYGLNNIINTNPDIVLASELWAMVPNPDFLQHLAEKDYDTSVFTPKSYDQNVRGTGTGLLVANSNITTKSICTTKITERISVLSMEQPKMEIINIYAPTSSKTKEEKDAFFEKLIETVNEIALREDNIVIGGDFNLKVEDNPLNSIEGLQSHVPKVATHQSGSIIDYFFATKSIEVSKIEVKVNGSSDHDVVSLDIKVPNFELNDEVYNEIMFEYVPIPKTDEQKIIFSQDIKKHLEGNLTKKELNFLNDSNQLVKTIKPSPKNDKILSGVLQKFENAIISAATKKKKSNLDKPNRIKVWSERCTILWTEMESIKKLPKSASTDETYNLKKKEFKAEVRRLKEAENDKNEEKLLEAYETDINSFYKVVKRLSKSTNKKPPLPAIFKKYQDIFGKKSTYEKIDFKQENYQHLSQADVTQALEKVKKGKASYKNLPIELWKLIDIGLLTSFFNSMLIYGVIPNDLLACSVKPLIKNGLESAKSADNWRPISLVHALSKALEVILAQKIDFVTSKQQYGFKKNSSTLKCYKDTINFIKDSKVENGIVWCVFLDMRKAFDSIPFAQLIKIVREKSETNFIARAFQNFITKSTVYIGENQNTGEKLEIQPNCGVKQGALNSPPLFTNVLDNFLKSERDCVIDITSASDPGIVMIEGKNRVKKGYADDLAIVTLTASQLAKSIREFEEFCMMTGLTPNADKTKIMVFIGSEINIKNFNPPTFTLCGDKLKYVDQYKYLGFQIHNSLNDKYHMEYLLSKFRKSVMAQRKIIKSNNLKLRLKLLKTYQLPKLYGLETISEATLQKYEGRFNYICSISLKRDMKETAEIQNNHNEIKLENLGIKARLRYREI